jgi:N-dimethylarginine dimethylaminohydrolase
MAKLKRARADICFVQVKKLYEEDSAFFVFNGTTPDLRLMQEQHLKLVRTYEKLNIKVHYSSWSEEAPRSAYGPMKRSISAAAGFVINGGAIIPREATPYWRGRSRYVSQFLMGLGCPILYTVRGNGVCEIGASTRMSDDFIVLMLSTDCNREGADQVIPIYTGLDTRRCISHTVPVRSMRIRTKCRAGCTVTCGLFRSTQSWH